MTASVSLPIAITQGDPAGCGPQITARAWEALRGELSAGFYVVGHPGYFSPHCEIARIADASEAAGAFANALPILSHGDATAITPGAPNVVSAAATISSIATAVEAVATKQASAVVTNPINKALLYKSGFTHPGHTEYLGKLCADQYGTTPTPIMMLVGGGLHVALATVHVPLMEVAAKLTEDRLLSVARIVARDLTARFGISAPRLAFTGLNPHAGESGQIGREEIEIINPAAAKLRSEGMDITDAQPADTVFAQALEGQYDAVIAMTHDQGLIPVKTLDMWGGVNCTLGLPIIRTSPDHGTAYDAAANGTARPDSLIAAIRLAAKMAERAA